MGQMTTGDIVLVVGNLLGGVADIVTKNNIKSSSDKIDSLLKDEGDDD